MTAALSRIVLALVAVLTLLIFVVLALPLGLMVLGGVQLVMIGVLGEYIGKILSELKARPIYFVAEHSEKRAGSDAAASGPERTAAE